MADKLKNVNGRMKNEYSAFINGVDAEMMKESGELGLLWLLEICKKVQCSLY